MSCIPCVLLSESLFFLHTGLNLTYHFLIPKENLNMKRKTTAFYDLVILWSHVPFPYVLSKLQFLKKYVKNLLRLWICRKFTRWFLLIYYSQRSKQDGTVSAFTRNDCFSCLKFIMTSLYFSWWQRWQSKLDVVKFSDGQSRPQQLCDINKDSSNHNKTIPITGTACIRSVAIYSIIRTDLCYLNCQVFS